MIIRFLHCSMLAATQRQFQLYADAATLHCPPAVYRLFWQVNILALLPVADAADCPRMMPVSRSFCRRRIPRPAATQGVKRSPFEHHPFAPLCDVAFCAISPHAFWLFAVPAVAERRTEQTQKPTL